MPPYQTPQLGDAPKEMQSEADKIYKGLRETKFHQETPGDRESASRVMWSVLKKTWTKDPKTSEWTKKTKESNLGTTYDDGPSSVVSDYAGAMELIAVGTDDRSDMDYDQDELALGIQTEMEHTGNGEIAARIAKDHLDEDPRYYSKMREYHLSMHNMALSSIYDIDQTRKSLVAMKSIGDPLVEYDIQKTIDGLDHAKTVAEMIVNGGEGSGNFGHAGRPGEVGGSGDGSSSPGSLKGSPPPSRTKPASSGDGNGITSPSKDKEYQDKMGAWAEANPEEAERLASRTRKMTEPETIGGDWKSESPFFKEPTPGHEAARYVETKTKGYEEPSIKQTDKELREMLKNPDSPLWKR